MSTKFGLLIDFDLLKARERERERERENFICHNIAKINNNTNGEYVAGCQKRLKAH